MAKELAFIGTPVSLQLRGEVKSMLLEQVLRFIVVCQQRFDFAAQLVVMAARSVEEFCSLRDGSFEGCREDFFDLFLFVLLHLVSTTCVSGWVGADPPAHAGGTDQERASNLRSSR